MAQVQVRKGDNGATNNAVSPASWASSTAGSLIVVAVSSYGAGSSNVPTITDSQANTYTQAYTFAPSASYRVTVFYLKNCPSGITSITVTVTARASIMALEESGIDTTAPLDVASASATDQAAVTAWASAAVTTTGSADLAIGIAASTAGANLSFASSGSWATLLSFNNAGDGDDSYSQVQRSVAAGSINAAGTCTSTRVYSTIVTFKAASSGTKAITPAAITATSSMTAAVQRLRPIPGAAVNATSAVTASVQRLRPLPVAAVTSTSTVTGSLTFLRAVKPAAITATSDVTATVTGGSGATYTPRMALLGVG